MTALHFCQWTPAGRSVPTTARLVALSVGGLLAGCSAPSEVLSNSDCVDLWLGESGRDLVGELGPADPFELDRIVVEYAAADGDNPRNYCVAYYLQKGPGPHLSFVSDGIDDWEPASYVGDGPKGAVQVLVPGGE